MKSTTPQLFHIPIDRRSFFKSMAIASTGFTLPGYLAEALTITPSTTQGPYYPLASNIPLDKDNDLIYLNDSLTAANGIVTYLCGRVLDASGNPVRGALVELWHADREGDYVYSNSAARNPTCDVNFAGFGQFLTGSDGQYKFRTIKAGLYPGRTRHYHIAVTMPGGSTRFCSQTFWNETALDLNGSPWAQQNSNDQVIQEMRNAGATTEPINSLILTYNAVPDTTTGEVYANFDFVRNVTPVQPAYPSGSFLIAGEPVAGPTNSMRFMLSIPAYTSYTYEVYGNPTLLDAGSVTNINLPYRTNMSWAALPFSLSPAGTINTNKFTAPTNGTLRLYVEEKAAKGFYYVAFRVPGANTGTP
jgi:protocatechuate 3,4-dioxygenase beta subunit